jgi:hypothetical protein
MADGLHGQVSPRVRITPLPVGRISQRSDSLNLEPHGEQFGPEYKSAKKGEWYVDGTDVLRIPDFELTREVR